MNWFPGDIVEAVAHSKAQNAIFVVYIEGKDENSEKLTTFLNNEKVWKKLSTDHFVAIKISSDSTEYSQFASIYTMVPVPSIFFIGQTGHPLEIGTSIMKSAEELEEKINRALAATNRNCSEVSEFPSTSSLKGSSVQLGSQITNTNQAVEPESSGSDLSDGLAPVAVAPSFKKSVTQQTTAATDVVLADVLPSASGVANHSINTTNDAPNDGEEKKEGGINPRLEETRKILEQRRRERFEKQKFEDKEQELRRRREGKDLQNLQQWQREQELKELKDNIRRERMEEMEARERIRAQIAADRAERVQKFSGPAAQPAATSTPSTSATSTAPGMTRLQFRFPNGLSKINTFENHQTLGDVRRYVTAILLPGTGIKEFVLATNYPKREFSADYDVRTLVELGLHPSALILIIVKDSTGPSAILSRSGGSFVDIISSLFWALITPVFAAIKYVKGVIGGRRVDNITGRDADANVSPNKRPNEDPQENQNEAAKRRNLDRFLGGASTSKESLSQPPPSDEPNDPRPNRPYGSSNIHRLADTRKDSNDENATWNGNSTQQQ